MKITKKDCESKQKVNIENYLTRKKINKENMEEIDIKIFLKKKKTKKDWKNLKKIIVKQKNQHEKFLSFFLYIV